VLELRDVSLRLGTPTAPPLLHAIDLKIPRTHFTAAVGPSGCGKSMLLKTIAGLREPTEGAVYWEGRDLAREGDLAPQEIGYVPQFSIAYDLLTVRESVENALALRVPSDSSEERTAAIDNVLAQTGLADIADRRAAVLSGGQKRRLSLALELVSSPHLLLCDEVTSGLDPQSEEDIVRLLAALSRENQRIVVTVTHSLRHLDLYDSVFVLYEGHLAYHGPGDLLCYYFDIAEPEALFARLTHQSGAAWNDTWRRHEFQYPLPLAADEREQAQAARESEQPADATAAESPEKPPEEPAVAIHRVHTPSSFAQTAVLLRRRWQLFFRDRTQLLLHAALLFGFPLIVVLFAWEGLPEMRSFISDATANPLQALIDRTSSQLQAFEVGGLVSGLVMFQVVLLTLVASNNSAREIAAERAIFEKEKFAGVRAGSYVASKTLFLGTLVLAQSAWMTGFVHIICRFPGDILVQMLLLILVNAAMTAVSLGISAWSRTAEQASLLSIYIVGFQLPLSGAVLALPAILSGITRPFIAAYWGWSGYLQTMRDTRFYDFVQAISQTPLSSIPLCIWVLATHVIAGILLAYAGCRHSRWE
jgi:ABC-type multidrug transport system ATPase subunit